MKFPPVIYLIQQDNVLVWDDCIDSHDLIHTEYSKTQPLREILSCVDKFTKDMELDSDNPAGYRSHIALELYKQIKEICNDS